MARVRKKRLTPPAQRRRPGKTARSEAATALAQLEVSRPYMKGYGIATDKKGMLAWDEATKQIRRSRNYWIITVRPDRRPHAVPVWGIWLDDAVYFGTDRRSRKGRNLAANPALVVHLESGDDAVILEGVAEEVEVGDRVLLDRIDKACVSKYKIGLLLGKTSVIYRLRPRVAFAWREKDFPRSATRWRFS